MYQQNYIPFIFQTLAETEVDAQAEREGNEVFEDTFETDEVLKTWAEHPIRSQQVRSQHYRDSQSVEARH